MNCSVGCALKCHIECITVGRQKLRKSKYSLTSSDSRLVSRTSHIFPTCTHARMTSGRGESAQKNTSGHSRQVFVSQPGMLG